MLQTPYLSSIFGVCGFGGWYLGMIGIMVAPAPLVLRSKKGFGASAGQ